MCVGVTKRKYSVSFFGSNRIFSIGSAFFSVKPCISSLAALERHLKRNDRCDRKTQKKMSEKGTTKR